MTINHQFSDVSMPVAPPSGPGCSAGSEHQAVVCDALAGDLEAAASWGATS
jgi:hypothetical protein